MLPMKHVTGNYPTYDKLCTALSTNVYNSCNEIYYYYSLEVINSKAQFSKYLWII